MIKNQDYSQEIDQYVPSKDGVKRVADNDDEDIYRNNPSRLPYGKKIFLMSMITSTGDQDETN